VTPPPNPTGGAWQPANPSDGMLKGKWWEIYQDPQLNQLEERIATNNVQLKQALETYLAARDQVSAARANLYPTLSASVPRGRKEFANAPLGTRQFHHLRRPDHCRPGQLGAGFLGPHSAHRGAGARQRAGQRGREPRTWISLCTPRWRPTTLRCGASIPRSSC
jgi:hypothetical protein